MAISALDSLLLGPLFTTDAMRACFTDEARLAAMLAAEAGLARAQARFGLVPAELAPAIEAITASSLDARALGRRTALAGVPSIPFVKAVQSRLPAALEPWFHLGATTQDVLDTALVLQLREALRVVEAELAAILPALATLARTHRATPCVGRTYGQHAAPITFGYKVAVWLTGIADIAARLPDIRARLLVVSLGGPVGTLAALGAHGPPVLAAFAEELGLGEPLICWHTLRAGMAETACWLAQLAGALAKMATDIAHLCSTEVGEVAEPYQPGRGGSSAMPHKRNPVSCTVILATQAAAKGHATTLLDAMAALHERPPGEWHGEWLSLPLLFGMLSGALREARRLAEGLEVNPARMRANLDLTHGLLFADTVATRLAPLLGRDAAHGAVEHAADTVRRTGAHLAEVLAGEPGLAGAGDLSDAFDLTPAIEAAAAWVDRATNG